MKLSFPQNGSTDLKPLDAAAGGDDDDDDVTGLLSALVLWTESRREERPGQPVGHAGQREHSFNYKAQKSHFISGTEKDAGARAC